MDKFSHPRIEKQIRVQQNQKKLSSQLIQRNKYLTISSMIAKVSLIEAAAAWPNGLILTEKTHSI